LISLVFLGNHLRGRQRSEVLTVFEHGWARASPSTTEKLIQGA
jgi:hypothetical protein